LLTAGFGGWQEENMKIQTKENIGTELLNADDMMKQWPKSEMLLFLGFPTSDRNSLCQRYWRDKENVTLTEIFELVISDDTNIRSDFIVSKMLDVQCIGIKAFLKVVRHMGKIDFGKKCNVVWKNKYTQFLNAQRVRGVRISWSSAITSERNCQQMHADRFSPPLLRRSGENG